MQYGIHRNELLIWAPGLMVSLPHGLCGLCVGPIGMITKWAEDLNFRTFLLGLWSNTVSALINLK